MNPDPFTAIHATLPGRVRNGKVVCACPFCGDEKKHFAYSEKGWYKCVRCGESGGSLGKLADLLRVEIGEWTPPKRIERPEPEIARWRLNPWRLLEQYRNHPERIARWQNYKPLTEETIERYGLGFGSLPFQRDNGDWYMSRSEWLIVPIYQDGALVALRGRNTGDRGPKWISGTGSNYALWNVENVAAGSVCWLCENYVDAAWLQQEKRHWSAVAIGGATTWRRDWATRLAAQRPALVVVALDKDLPGNGGGNHRDELIAEWKAEHPGAAIPRANGPLIANDLRRAGVDARLFEWPDDAPVKAGLDWALGN